MRHSLPIPKCIAIKKKNCYYACMFLSISTSGQEVLLETKVKSELHTFPITLKRRIHGQGLRHELRGAEFKWNLPFSYSGATDQKNFIGHFDFHTQLFYRKSCVYIMIRRTFVWLCSKIRYGTTFTPTYVMRIIYTYFQNGWFDWFLSQRQIILIFANFHLLKHWFD